MNEYWVLDKGSAATYSAYMQARIHILMNIHVETKTAFISVLFSPQK
jgi:hypothetical protein